MALPASRSGVARTPIVAAHPEWTLCPVSPSALTSTNAAASPRGLFAEISIHGRDSNLSLGGKQALEGDSGPQTCPQFSARWVWSVPAGEKGRLVIEQIASRLGRQVANGIWGGYIGEGAKTVIPAEASAKISFRLVGSQDPVKIREAFRRFVHHHLPPDCKAEFKGNSASPAISLDWHCPSPALSEEWGKEALLIGVRRLDPGRRRFQTPRRPRHAPDRLRPRRRPHPFAEREDRSHELPQRHAQLGARPRRPRGVSMH